MRKIIMILVVAIAAAIGVSAVAQDQEAAKDSGAEASRNKSVQPYRLDFSFNEIADGKTVNTRHYSMNLVAGNPNEIKIGTRVPVAVSSSPTAPSPMQYQYLDVGTNIWSQLREHSDELSLAVRAEVSNLDVTTGDHAGAFLPPVVRQIKIDGETLLVVGKPLLIGSVDDPNSKRQFQLEVTITRLK